MLTFRFDFPSTLQASAFLLALGKGRMSYLRLLKLLYVADREAVLEHGRPITGGRAVAMKNGPVLSEVLDAVNHKSPHSPEWEKFIRRDHYQVELVADPGRKNLSKNEAKKLGEVFERYTDLDDWSLVEETHQFAEWKKSYPGGNGAGDISWEDVLVAAGKADWVENIRKDVEELNHFDDLLEWARANG